MVKEVSLAMGILRWGLVVCAMCAALFPSVIKIYETSWQFREAADPSVYDEWRDYFAEKPVILNADMTGLSDKNLLRLHIFIVPYFVAAGTLVVAFLLPKREEGLLSGVGWLTLRSLLRRSVHCPTVLQAIFPARVTIGELVGVVVFLCMNWGIFAARVERSLYRGSRKLTFLVDTDKDASKKPIDPNSWQACEVWALTIGIMAVINMGWYLFLPIGKRSVFLDMFGISWDSAIKFHRWIGYYTFWLSVVHGVMYLALFLANDGSSKFDPDGVLVKHNLHAAGCDGEDECDEDQQLMLRRNMYGIASIVLLVVMVVCSMASVRRHFFNVFYAMHHLVFVILLFLCLHYKGTIILVLPGLATYMIDKLLGLLAWANSVQAHVEVAKGVVEVSVPLDSGASYLPGQYVQVNVPAASVFEWHPFSITSAPHQYDGKLLTFHIKGLGDWTNKVMESVREGTMQVRLDGFYGHDLAAGMRHKAAVVLVGGGIGVTPMISVAMSLLHGGARNVHLLWVVRSIEEFSMFAAQLSAAACKHPEQLEVKVWITLSGAANKGAVTVDDALAQVQPRDDSKQAWQLSGTPSVAPNRWTLPPAAQALVTALAILTSMAAFGLSQWVGSSEKEWKPDSQRVFDLFLVILSLFTVVIVALVPMILWPLLNKKHTSPSPSRSASSHLVPGPGDGHARLLAVPSISPHDGPTPYTGQPPIPVLGGQIMMHGAAFGQAESEMAHVVTAASPPIASFTVAAGAAPGLQPLQYPATSWAPAYMPYPPPVLMMPQAPALAPHRAAAAAPTRQAALNMLEGRLGKRPDVAAEFEAIAAATSSASGAIDIGVMACGPQSLLAKVTASCNDRSWTMLNQEPFYSFSEEDWEW